MKRLFKKKYLASTLVLAALIWVAVPQAEAQQEQSGTLVVQVTNARSNLGVMCVNLFSSKDGFPKNSGKAYKKGCMKVVGNKATFVFNNVPFGTYAATALHDEDGNGKMKTNWIGMPKEGVGATNGAGGMGGPSFKDAKFSFAAEKKTVYVKLKYL